MPYHDLLAAGFLCLKLTGQGCHDDEDHVMAVWSRVHTVTTTVSPLVHGRPVDCQQAT